MFRTRSEFPQPEIPAAVYAIPIMANPGVKEKSAEIPDVKGKEKGVWWGNLAKARRVRDFPDIHSASSARGERHERVCGLSHSIPRRRDAPRRTSGCDLSPALDLDVEGFLLAVRLSLDSELK
jgi:hypothetical protein